MRGGNLKNILHTLLIVFAASAYAQDNFSSSHTSNLSAEKAGQTKWEVKGSIGDTVVVVNGRGDTSAVEVGSEIEGCLVTVRKVVCDTAEKKAVKNNDRQMKEIEDLREKEGELQKHLAQLNQEKKEVEANAGRCGKENKEL
ncbi:MAG TPA: hypothetical protein VEJ88_08965, partial [Dissulfurispiraceae bacterium]|nr:hypothetical protein [Dissulfurispiraceae bacterium]